MIAINRGDRRRRSLRLLLLLLLLLLESVMKTRDSFRVYGTISRAARWRPYRRRFNRRGRARAAIHWPRERLNSLQATRDIRFDASWIFLLLHACSRVYIPSVNVFLGSLFLNSRRMSYVYTMFRTRAELVTLMGLNDFRSAVLFAGIDLLYFFNPAS